jgi:hypothetical protein
LKQLLNINILLILWLICFLIINYLEIRRHINWSESYWRDGNQTNWMNGRVIDWSVKWAKRQTITQIKVRIEMRQTLIQINRKVMVLALIRRPLVFRDRTPAIETVMKDSHHMKTPLIRFELIIDLLNICNDYSLSSDWVVIDYYLTHISLS